MKNTTALDTLLALSGREADAAAERLGRAVAQRSDADQRLAMLNQLRDEYAQRLRNAADNGLSFASYRNYQRFMEKIEQAIAGQQDIEAAARMRAEYAQQEWQARRHEGKTWELLRDRAQQVMDRKAGVAERKLMDEFAARAGRRAQEAG